MTQGAGPRRRRRSREDILQRIREAARKLFADRGFGATTTKEIAQLADVSETLVFRYYRDKAGLFNEVVTEPFQELMDAFVQRHPDSATDGTMDADTRRFTRQIFELFEANEETFRALLSGPKASADAGVALVEERRRRPGDDLVSLLANTEADGDYLPEVVLISFLRQLMNAAGDTTYRGTSILLTALLENPSQFEAIRADRTLIPAAIEEALRWDGPVAVQTRMAKEDTELGGIEIPAGSLLDVVAAAANRDPALFPEPDRFDIFRERKPHFSFSRGPHICVGQHLARVEMTRALHAVLDSLPNLRFDPDRPKPEIRGSMMRVPRHLHVRFGD